MIIIQGKKKGRPTLLGPTFDRINQKTSFNVSLRHRLHFSISTEDIKNTLNFYQNMQNLFY